MGDGCTEDGAGAYSFIRMSGMLDLSRDEKAKVGWLRPCRRAVNRAAVRSYGNHFGQLALRRKVAGDVLVIGGYGTEFFTGALVRIEHDNGFSRALLEIVKRRDEVGVAGDEYDAVKILFHVVDEHLGSDVYVRSFLFGFPHCCDGNLLAGLAGFLCKRIAGAESFIVALDDLQFIVFFISIFQKGKGRTFARPCTASPRLSGRLTTHQGVRRVLYQIAFPETSGGIRFPKFRGLAVFPMVFTSLLGCRGCLNRCWRIQCERQLDYALSRECIREVFYVAASSAVQGANLAS